MMMEYAENKSPVRRLWLYIIMVRALRTRTAATAVGNGKVGDRYQENCGLAF